MANARKVKKFWLVFLFAAIATSVIWSGSFFISRYLALQFQYDFWEGMAQLGDSFGMINALFSGLAFAGIIATLVLQQDDLNLQREELRGSRKEFQVNRITTVIYKQVEKTNDAIAGFKTKIISKEREGIAGLVEWSMYLDQVKNDLDLIRDLEDEKILRAIDIHKNKFLEGGTTALYGVLQAVESSVSLINELLKSEELEEAERAALKEIYKKNLPSVLIEVMQKIRIQFETQLY